MGKERFLWYQTFFFISTPLLIIAAVRKQVSTAYTIDPLNSSPFVTFDICL
jgi:hypothetical protein